jgi:hypothetical protein
MTAYEIQTQNDFKTGAALVVRIPEEDVDKKALYTILSEQPDFILPFRHRSIDGQIEFTYQIGNRSKLAYLSGSRSPEEYADLWFGILQPLLDCEDWFMTPFSFVLRPEYLYCDKSGKSISYVYVPSVQSFSDQNTLKSMVTDVAKQNHVTDVSLENKIVWAIQDFNPNEFLQIFKLYKANFEDKSSKGVSSNKTEERLYVPPTLSAASQPKAQTISPANEQKPVVSRPVSSSVSRSDDISINFPSGGKDEKAAKPKVGLFGSKKEKEPKPPKKEKVQKEKTGLFGKKKPAPQEIIQGAAALPQANASPQAYPNLSEHLAQTPSLSSTEVDDDVTQLDLTETDSPTFRYIGNGDHPRIIEVIIAEGEIFTVGRFDTSVGVKQSTFEFDKKTKAVSRRHAAIERNGGEYVIVDLNSAAGTFVNGQKLSPNTPSKLEHNCKVSFGHSGADYVWEG